MWGTSFSLFHEWADRLVGLPQRAMRLEMVVEWGTRTPPRTGELGNSGDKHPAIRSLSSDISANVKQWQSW